MSTQQEIPGHYSCESAAQILNITVETVRYYAYTGKLKSNKFGRDLWIPKAEVRRYKKERRPPGNPNFGK